MPRFAPLVKVSQCRACGAEVDLFGERVDDARQRAAELARSEGLTLVHGFDDPLVIEGQGTLALELLEHRGDLEMVIAPVGGGGLLAGMALALAERAPHVQIIAVEAAHAPTLTRALEAGAPAPTVVEPGLADGLAVARLGTHCFEAIRGRVGLVERVGEDEIAGAIMHMMCSEKAVVEGRGPSGSRLRFGGPRCSPAAEWASSSAAATWTSAWPRESSSAARRRQVGLARRSASHAKSSRRLDLAKTAVNEFLPSSVGSFVFLDSRAE